MKTAQGAPLLYDQEDSLTLYERMLDTGRKLADKKWVRYCEGLEGVDRAFTAVLLENTEKFIGRMDETTRILNIGNFDKFAFPLVRAIYPNLITNEIVSVQPMAGPVSLIFYLDFVFGNDKGNIAAGTSAFDSIAGPTDTRFYSSDDVNKEQVAVASSSAGPFASTLAFLPVRRGTVTVTGPDGTSIGNDNGIGVISGTGIASGTVDYDNGSFVVTFTGAQTGPVEVSYRYDTEANEAIPQLDLQLTSSPVTARSRKLRARWSLEAAQNLNALHGLDAEAELVGVMAEQVKFEIDREVINDLFNIAVAGSVSFSKTVPAGISFTEHKLSFIDTLIEGSNLIFSATKRGQANFLISSVGASNLIETQPTFVPVPGALQTPGTTGIIKIGTLNNRWTVYKDPFLGFGLAQPDIFITGYKGQSFLEAGYVYAPYIPLYTTPTVVLDDFIGRKGMATQYGKRVVNPRFYATGKVVS